MSFYKKKNKPEMKNDISCKTNISHQDDYQTTSKIRIDCSFIAND
jgi:hypothetical protein